MKLSLSIIIPSYNSIKTIDKCLSSIFNSRYNNYEVIVVSDNSNDNSDNIIKKYPCKLIKLNKNVMLLPQEILEQKKQKVIF